MSFHPRHPAEAEQAHKKEAALEASKGRSAPSEDPGGVQTGEPIRKMSLSRPKEVGCEPPSKRSSQACYRGLIWNPFITCFVPSAVPGAFTSATLEGALNDRPPGAVGVTSSVAQSLHCWITSKLPLL